MSKAYKLLETNESNPCNTCDLFNLCKTGIIHNLHKTGQDFCEIKNLIIECINNDIDNVHIKLVNENH